MVTWLIDYAKQTAASSVLKTTLWRCVAATGV